MDVLLMEEHYQAYFAWKARGIQNAWCWHVDAHLDIGQVGLGNERLAEIRGCTSHQQASAKGCLGNSYLPWGGLHCGNYLYPAIKEGIVGKLTWVIPPDLPEMGLMAWTKHHLNEWFELSPDEFRSLQVLDERVEGTILGIPFELGTVEALQLPTEPVLLDIDIDYFLEEDGSVWLEAEPFAEKILSVPSLFTTVAYSVKGGFTPEKERRLAAPWTTDKAEQFDSQLYQERPIDELAALVRCHRHEEALKLVDSMSEQTLEASYLRGTSLHALKRYQETLELWELLLERESLPPDGKLYLHNLCGELHLSLQQPDQALEHCKKAQKLDRKSYAPCWLEAQAREQLGETQKAIKALRKAARLSEDKIFGLKIRTALIRTYRRQGKEGLAMAEARKLNQMDPDSRVRAFATLGL